MPKLNILGVKKGERLMFSRIFGVELDFEAGRAAWPSWPTVCIGSQASPEHSKPPMFLQISLESFMFDALGYKS